MKTRSLSRRPVRFRPECETLEGRSLPAVTATFAGSVITITGDDLANNISILDEGNDGATPEVQVFSKGVKILSVDGKLVSAITAVLKGGDDRVNYFYVDGLDKDVAGIFTRSVAVNLGKGNDTFLSVLGEGFIDGGSLSLFVVGGIGDDHLTNQGLTDFDGLVPESLNVFFQGNKGQDTLTHIPEEPDVLDQINETSTVLFDWKGGKDTDSIGASFLLDLDNSFTFKANGEDGDDEIDVRFTLDAGSGAAAPPTPALTVQLSGDKNKDNLTLVIVNNSANPITFTNVIDGGTQQDTCSTAGGNVPVAVISCP